MEGYIPTTACTEEIEVFALFPWVHPFSIVLFILLHAGMEDGALGGKMVGERDMSSCISPLIS